MSIKNSCPYEGHKNRILKRFRYSVPKNQIRIIHPQATHIESLGNFNHQISGPCRASHDNSLEILHEKLLMILPPYLANRWLERLQILSDIFNSRKPKALSAGEKILLSCARCWFSWEAHIKFLLIDEGDGALDQINKTLLFDTLQDLKEKIAILIISHDISTILTNSSTLSAKKI